MLARIEDFDLRFDLESLRGYAKTHPKTKSPPLKKPDSLPDGFIKEPKPRPYEIKRSKRAKPKGSSTEDRREMLIRTGEQGRRILHGAVARQTG